VSVLAGHFSWGVWSQLPSMSRRTATTAPPCFVMGRHPVDRVVSYYYQRCYGEPNCAHYRIPFNNLTRENLVSFVLSFRQALVKENGEVVVVDEGTQEACCRALANRKTTSGLPVHEIKFPEPLTVSEEEFALGNVDHCVVGLQEEWASTKRVLEHWFPWIDTGVKMKTERMNMSLDHESLEEIRPDLRATVEEMNVCDMRLYEKMRTLFEKQLSVIDSVAYL
jgi:hypothetical protein